MKTEWIYTQEDWPLFSWNNRNIPSQLSDFRCRSGIFKSKVDSLEHKHKYNILLASRTDDILKSNAIEGKTLHEEDVRSSVAKRLEIKHECPTPISNTTESTVQTMLEPTINYEAAITTERLFRWHRALFPVGCSDADELTVAAWRNDSHGPMQVVSEKNYKTTVHFQAPPAEEIPREIKSFIKWFNDSQDLDPVIKAGIAHLWFVTLHPFDDGNGRISRMLADQLLTQAEGGERLYSMSDQINIERKDYYTQLESQQRGSTDITLWLEWFISCIDRALATTEARLNNTLHKEKLWGVINEQDFNERQMKILERMLADDFTGFMNTKKYSKMTKCIEKTAQSDINQLVDKEIFIQNSICGRNISYRLKE